MKITKAQVLHFLGLAAAAVLGVVADQAGTSHWVWAPIVVALATNLRTALGGGAKAALLIVAVGLGLTSCATTGPTPPPGTPGIVNCEDAALHQAALNVLPAVENALAADNYESALAGIIASVAGPLALESVECAVEWIASKAAEQAPDSLEATKQAHGRAWLAKQNVSFR